jgi:hypothetical protein
MGGAEEVSCCYLQKITGLCFQDSYVFQIIHLKKRLQVWGLSSEFSDCKSFLQAKMLRF